MRRFFSFTCFVLVIIPCVVMADTEVKISGQVRMRNAAGKPFFYHSEPFGYSNDLRTRIGARATVDSFATAVVELQDSRDLFAQDSGSAISGTTTGIANIDLHQAYLQVHHPSLSRLELTLGRFELSFGNGRLIGTDDWDNVGRAFQGGKLVYSLPFVKSTAFLLAGPSTRRPVDSSILLWGISADVPGVHIEPLFYYENMAVDRYIYQGPHIHSSMRRYTGGLYGNHASARAFLVWNAAYQFGHAKTIIDRPYGGSGRDDIDAWLVAAEAGVTSRLFGKSTYSIGVDATSGDDDWGDKTQSTFVAPYASIHSFHGHMTFLEWQLADNFWLGRAGLKDLYSGITIEPHPKVSLDLTIHNYSTYRDYHQQSWSLGQLRFNSARRIGWEYSATVSAVPAHGVNWELGGFFFHPSREYAEEFDPNPGFWGYSMMTVGF